MKSRVLVPILALHCAYICSAYGGRVMKVVPLHNLSAHAGAGGCVTADYWVPGLASLPSCPDVNSAFHEVEISVANVGTTNQTVTLKILPGSGEGATYSSSGSSVPDVNGPTLTVPTATTYTNSFVLTPGQSSLVSARFLCTANKCKLEFPAGTVVQGSTDAAPPGKNCIQLGSLGMFQIDVTEDAGAVVASMTTTIHRICGMADHYITPPTSILVNGGHPF